jgi:hypothetical protein
VATLEATCDELLSSFSFDSNLSHYITDEDLLLDGKNKDVF